MEYSSIPVQSSTVVRQLPIAALDAHEDDFHLPHWEYDQKDARPREAPDEEWAPWLDAKPPKIYCPPQFRYGPFSACFIPVLYYHRAGPPGCDLCCMCCIPCCNRCCLLPCGKKKYVQITEPDEWFLEMLQTPAHPNCPEFLKGVWWMQDNPGSETICTMHQGNWVTNRVGFVDTRYNYAHDAENLAGFGGAAYQLYKNISRFEVSPNGRWINIGGQSWLYRLEPGDNITYEDGEPLHYAPGDMMRVSYLDEPIDMQYKSTGQHTLMFQYLFRRVAYLDAQGNMVMTPAYDELYERANGPFKKTCCGEDGCGFFNPEEVPENDWQTVGIQDNDELADFWDQQVEKSELDGYNAANIVKGLRYGYKAPPPEDAPEQQAMDE